MLKKKYPFSFLILLSLLILLLGLGFTYNKIIGKKTEMLCLEGELTLGRVVDIYEPFRKERVDFEIEYTVNGKKYIEKCSNGKYLFYFDDLIWILYNNENPESSQAFYQIAEQYEYNGKYIDVLDLSRRYEEMNTYKTKCKCVSDSLTQVSYYGFLRYSGD